MSFHINIQFQIRVKYKMGLDFRGLIRLPCLSTLINFRWDFFWSYWFQFEKNNPDNNDVFYKVCRHGLSYKSYRYSKHQSVNIRNFQRFGISILILLCISYPYCTEWVSKRQYITHISLVLAVYIFLFSELSSFHIEHLQWWKRKECKLQVMNIEPTYIEWPPPPSPLKKSNLGHKNFEEDF